MTYQIRTSSQTLSDGSKVYNVKIGSLTLHATTETHADLLVDKIAAAINEHTVDDAVGKYVW